MSLDITIETNQMLKSQKHFIFCYLHFIKKTFSFDEFGNKNVT